MPAEPELSEPLMSYDEWLESPARMLFLRPSMYAVNSRLDCVESYLHGFDHGHPRGLLNGFREWLDLELGYIGSSAAVRYRLISHIRPEWEDSDLLDPELEKTVLAEYLRVLDKFIAERTEFGLADILKRQQTFEKEYRTMRRAEWAARSAEEDGGEPDDVETV